MSAEYELWLLHHATGQILASLADFVSLDYTRIVNDVGTFTLELPGTFDLRLAQEDTRLAVFRKPANGTRKLEFVGLVRRRQKSSASGVMRYVLRGPDLNDLLRRRIIAYAAASAEADKAATYADDMIKAFVRENLGALATVAARDLSAYEFSVEADHSVGTSVTKAAAWRNLLTVIKEVAEASCTTPATAVYFGITPLDIGWPCEFRTKILCWGDDHRYAGAGTKPVIFSLELGNLNNAAREVDYLNEIDYVYAGGQGQEAARVIQEASDAARIGMSPFNRCEKFVNSSYTDDATQVMSQANSEVRNGLPKLAFSGTLQDTQQQVYGRDYGFGDYVTAQFDGETIDCRIDRVTVRVDGDKEDVQITLKSET